MHGGLVADVRQDARAEVVDEDDAAILREPTRSSSFGRLREAHHPEIRLVHAKQDGGALADRTLVVLDPRAVRRADLDEAGSRAREHLGNPEAVADLDELAARDETSRPSASAATARRTAAALLLTTSAASAPVRSRSRGATWSWREPRVPSSRSYSRFEYPPATSWMRSRARAASGARPRFVWTMTPVALRTRRSLGAAVPCRKSRASATRSLGLLARGDPLAGRVDRLARGLEGQLVAVLGLEQRRAARPGGARLRRAVPVKDSLAAFRVMIRRVCR